MSKLTDEEKKELAALEEEVEVEAEADADASVRQHLEAMRLRKKYTAKGQKHGTDFGVIETKIGNFVIRKPKDTEIDTLLETPEDRAANENFVAALMLEPTAAEVQMLFPDNPGLIGAVSAVALELAKVTRAAEVKK